MCSVKANSGVWMENTRPWKPPISQPLHPGPCQVVLLTPMDQHSPPEPNDPVTECASALTKS
jgi:hypothetical protein